MVARHSMLELPMSPAAQWTCTCLVDRYLSQERRRMLLPDFGWQVVEAGDLLEQAEHHVVESRSDPVPGVPDDGNLAWEGVTVRDSFTRSVLVNESGFPKETNRDRRGNGRYLTRSRTFGGCHSIHLSYGRDVLICRRDFTRGHAVYRVGEIRVRYESIGGA